MRAQMRQNLTKKEREKEKEKEEEERYEIRKDYHFQTWGYFTKE